MFESSRTLWLYLHIPQTGLEFFQWRLFLLGFEISRKRILPRTINDAHISLISKEKDAVAFSEFRRISLLNSEGLSVLTKRAEDGGFFTGISSGHGRTVTHLQHANDTVIFSKDDQESLLNIKRILRCFELRLGMKINLHKSSIMDINVDDSFSEGMAGFLRWRKDTLPFKYLGLPG